MEESGLLEPLMILMRMVNARSPSLNQALDYSHKSMCLQGDMSGNIPCLVLIKVMAERMPEMFCHYSAD